MPHITKTLVLFVFLPFLIQCQQSSIEEQAPSILFQKFKSHQNIAEIMSIMRDEKYDIKIFENSSLPPGDKRPEFSSFIIDVENYRVSDLKIKLRLMFLNKKLYSVVVFSGDEKVLEKEPDIKIIKNIQYGKCSGVRKNVKVCRYIDYYSFSDERIEKYMHDWIIKFA